MERRWHASPNHGPRIEATGPSLVVLHYTEERDAATALDILSDPGRAVSSHYLVGRDGTLWQLVDETRRAWHAGEGAWGGVTDVNSHSIGIELDNDGAGPFAAPLMGTLVTLLAELLGRHGIEPRGVIAHSDLAPGRKIDPGRHFDWRALAARGLAVWPDPPLRTEGDFWTDARAFGYPVGRVGVTDEAVLDSFRQRFRPDIRGPLQAIDAALIATLAARYPARVAS